MHVVSDSFLRQAALVFTQAKSGSSNNAYEAQECATIGTSSETGVGHLRPAVEVIPSRTLQEE